jgi:hypothetical protein
MPMPSWYCKTGKFHCSKFSSISYCRHIRVRIFSWVSAIFLDIFLYVEKIACSVMSNPTKKWIFSWHKIFRELQPLPKMSCFTVVSAYMCTKSNFCWYIIAFLIPNDHGNNGPFYIKYPELGDIMILVWGASSAAIHSIQSIDPQT